MFESLAEQIKHDEHEQVSNRERVIRYVIYAVVSVLIFGGLIAAVRMGGA